MMSPTDERRLRLGLLLERGQSIEVLAGTLLGSLLGNVNDGLILAGRMSTSGVLNACRDLAGDDEAVRGWCSSAEHGLKIRNRYVHGQWGEVNDDPARALLLHRGQLVTDDVDPLPILDKACADLEEVIASARSLTWLASLYDTADES